MNPNIPGHNKMLRRVFRGAVGALDGTLIYVVVPIKEQDLYRGRGKGDCYQNVLAISDFNMIFTFIVAGWEGVAYDSRILSEALSDQQKFNHTHAKLRNVIERASGVLKARFPILKRMASFSLETQRNLTVACFALHNLIRKEGLSDESFEQYDQPDVSFRNTHVHVADEDEVEAHGTASDREYMTQLRDEIAEQLMQSTE
ncbi:uncharacterized protein LOC143560559 [Bidens hawaiensis]|uniref:uncharacterized protein LOC143560559 n=1 Tax=Bidens hawaiensis TaxID=980011 RepID=UPI00404B417E